MSEALDKVRGVRELPLFPLPVVLFPGMPMPLHIFEPRYRKMLTDIRANDNLFGLSYFDKDSSGKDMPLAGHIGCVAEVTETQALPDGRSNVLAVGVIRYRVDAYVERGDPYLVVRVNFFEDDDEDDVSLTKINDYGYSPPSQDQGMMTMMGTTRMTETMTITRPEIPNTRPRMAALRFTTAAVSITSRCMAT